MTHFKDFNEKLSNYCSCFNNCFKQHFYFANGMNNTICQMDFHTGSDNGAQWNVISNFISLGPESCWALLGIQLAVCKLTMCLNIAYIYYVFLPINAHI